MKNFEGTPGPWVAQGNYISSPDVKCIAILHPEDGKFADLMLMAAALDMAETLQYCLNKIHSLDNTPNGVRRDLKIDVSKMKHEIEASLKNALGGSYNG